MDPFSIFTASAGLAFSVFQAITTISKFVSDVRGARKDMDRVSTQLMSLQLCLEALSGDGFKRNVTYPDDMRDQINQILLACDANVAQIIEILSRLRSGKLGRRIQWTLSDSDDVDKIRSSLESNKTALDIALSIGTITLLARSSNAIKTQGDQIAIVVQKSEAISISTTTIEQKIDNLTDMHKDTTKLDRINYELVELRRQMGELVCVSAKQQSLKDFIAQAQRSTQHILSPFAPQLACTVNTTIESVMRIEPIVPQPHAGSPESTSATLVDYQVGATHDSCPVCSNAISSPRQEEALRRFRTERADLEKQLQSATEAQLVQAQSLRDGMEKFEKDLYEKVSKQVHSMRQEHEATVTRREAQISELLHQIDMINAGTQQDDDSHDSALQARADEFIDVTAQLQEAKERLQSQEAEITRLNKSLNEAIAQRQRNSAIPTAILGDSDAASSASLVSRMSMLAKRYNETQKKTLTATSNSSNGPNGTEMAEIAALTFNRYVPLLHAESPFTDVYCSSPTDYYEIMDILDLRLNDKAEDWRHLYKALKLLDYLLHEGSELCVQWARKNIYIIKTLREFNHVDKSGIDAGSLIRLSAQDLTSLILDEERLRGERADRKLWKSRFNERYGYGAAAK